MIARAQYLQGIGSGVDVNRSGEAAVLKKLCKATVVGRELCIFDVGANTGQFVALVASLLNGTGVQIHSFEPSRETFAVLTASVRR